LSPPPAEVRSVDGIALHEVAFDEQTSGLSRASLRRIRLHWNRFQSGDRRAALLLQHGTAGIARAQGSGLTADPKAIADRGGRPRSGVPACNQRAPRVGWRRYRPRATRGPRRRWMSSPASQLRRCGPCVATMLRNDCARRAQDPRIRSWRGACGGGERTRVLQAAARVGRAHAPHGTSRCVPAGRRMRRILTRRESGELRTIHAPVSVSVSVTAPVCVSACVSASVFTQAVPRVWATRLLAVNP
jgi:hypothetical protein